MQNQILSYQRFEIKYFLSRSQFDELQKLMKSEMTPEPYGHSLIRNVYYDTDNFYLIRHSIEKPTFKEKLRLRSYTPAGPEDSVFIELKKKYQGEVQKSRISMPYQQAVSCLAGRQPFPLENQFTRELDYILQFYKTIHPVLFLCFERDAFSSPNQDLRITFDQNIRYRRDHLSLSGDTSGKDITDPGQYLMEIKTSVAVPMWLTHFLSAERLYKTTFSKYGTAYLDFSSRLDAAASPS